MNSNQLLEKKLPDFKGQKIQHPFLDDIRVSIREKYNSIASKRTNWIEKNPYYYKRLIRELKYLIKDNSSILHVKCGIGYILNELQPAYGVGIEDSIEQIKIAKSKYEDLTFYNSSVEYFDIDKKFDYILINSLEDIVDISSTMQSIKKNCSPKTRIILINYNYIWKPFVTLAEKLRLKVPQELHNWISESDTENIIKLNDFDLISKEYSILIPYNIPIISYVFNRFIARLPILKWFSLTRISVARINPSKLLKKEYSVSVIIPCKNEAGNVEDAVKRIPKLGSHTEIIFCDDKSEDGTKNRVLELIKEYPEKDIKIYDGPAISKSKNVWTGFDKANGDILMILDADLTVIPEELPPFYEAIANGTGEFINGSRLVYPMHGQAMKFFNVLGNIFFSFFFSYILDFRIKDTLCGTKVLWREDYYELRKLRGSWGIDDRWGDYELIFGAAKLNLKHIDLPVHYYERTYGETKMTNVLKNGWIMLKMSLAALFKHKFRF